MTPAGGDPSGDCGFSPVAMWVNADAGGSRGATVWE